MKRIYNPFVSIFYALNEEKEDFRTQTFKKRMRSVVIALWGFPALPAIAPRSGLLDYLTIIPFLRQLFVEKIEAQTILKHPIKKMGMWLLSNVVLGVPAFLLNLVNLVITAVLAAILSPIVGFIHFCVWCKNKWDERFIRSSFEAPQMVYQEDERGEVVLDRWGRLPRFVAGGVRPVQEREPRGAGDYHPHPVHRPIPRRVEVGRKEPSEGLNPFQNP